MFAFHDGAKAALQQAEMSGFAQDLRDQGRGHITSPAHTVRDGWRVGAFEELHSGRIAILERANAFNATSAQLVIGPAPLDTAISIGDTVSLTGVGHGRAVQMVQSLDAALGLGR